MTGLIRAMMMKESIASSRIEGIHISKDEERALIYHAASNGQLTMDECREIVRQNTLKEENTTNYTGCRGCGIGFEDDMQPTESGRCPNCLRELSEYGTIENTDTAASFTPGPLDYFFGDEIRPDEVTSLVDSTGRLVCVFDHCRSNANARLFKHSPEMFEELDALADAAAALNDYHQDDELAVRIEAARTLVQKIRRNV